jgi:hypothetical protein
MVRRSSTAARRGVSVGAPASNSSSSFLIAVFEAEKGEATARYRNSRNCRFVPEKLFAEPHAEHTWLPAS